MSSEVFTFKFDNVKQKAAGHGTKYQFSETIVELPKPIGDLSSMMVEISQTTVHERDHWNTTDSMGYVLTYDVANLLSVAHSTLQDVKRLDDIEVLLQPKQYHESPDIFFRQNGRAFFNNYRPQITIRNLSDFKHFSRDLIFLSNITFESDIKVTVTYFY